MKAIASPGESQSEQPTMEDGWLVDRDEQTGVTIRTRELTLYPKPEPLPALKYHLIPDEFSALPGNAAIYYLKALGFLEQDVSRERLNQMRKDAAKKAQKEDKDYSDVPPEAWRFMPPDQLPLKEVKEYLQLTEFQVAIVREAARRAHFDMDRQFRDMTDPIAYLLPEIQAMRELARTQSLRRRLAIAERRIDDAIEILGQQFVMAHHLSQDEFLVTNLVGIAIAGIAWDDALYLLQLPDTPNLYWALRSMPTPLVDIRRSMANERQLLYQQVKVLQEADETPRPVGYWRDFLDRLMSQLGYLGSELNLPSVQDDPRPARAVLAGYVAAAYPGAKEYLIQVWKMPRQRVEAYPTAQVVFLAAVRYYDQWRDEYFKWMRIPVWQVRTKPESSRVDNAMRAAAQKYGLCAAPANLLLPAVLAARTAEARCEQTIALLETVEAIRMYGAAHGGKLPASLDDLPVPAPLEPFTGKPIEYKLSGAHAVVTGHALPGLQYRLNIRFAKQPQ